MEKSRDVIPGLSTGQGFDPETSGVQGWRNRPCDRADLLKV